MISKVAALLTLLSIFVIAEARPHYYSVPSPSFPKPHRAILENDAQEAQFPEYLKNPFYRTPRVRNVLERFSRLQYGETIVENRIADAVPRKEIFKLLAHAGLINRADFPYAR